MKTFNIRFTQNIVPELGDLFLQCIGREVKQIKQEFRNNWSLWISGMYLKGRLNCSPCSVWT